MRVRRVVITGTSPVQALDVTSPFEVFSRFPDTEWSLGIRREIRFLDWIRKAVQRSRRVALICTETSLLAAAGLLDGKQTVTHWRFCDRLARKFPAISVQRDPIYLRDRSVYTFAGITADIDFSLAMVEEDCGHDVALAVARQLVMFLVRPGGQSQYSHVLSQQAIRQSHLRELQRARRSDRGAAFGPK
jgi:transcriptional regulator GlxA family with amidase domain